MKEESESRSHCDDKLEALPLFVFRNKLLTNYCFSRYILYL